MKVTYKQVKEKIDSHKILSTFLRKKKKYLWYIRTVKENQDPLYNINIYNWEADPILYLCKWNGEDLDKLHREYCRTFNEC